MDPRAQLIIEHGSDAIAYSTLQPGLEYFDTSFGYVAYRLVNGVRLTLGPPVCASGNRLALAERFLSRLGPAVFFYVPEDFAAELSGRMFATGIGIDRVLPLGRGSITGSKQVQGAVRKAEAAGFRIEPLSPRTLDPKTRAQLKQLNARYLQARPLPYEMRFLNRPMQLDGEDLGRHFALRWSEAGVEAVRGYVRLNPYFRGGRPRGYLLDVLRFGPTRLWGVFYATVMHLAAELEKQGMEELSLGFCPLFHAKTGVAVSRSRVLDWQMGWLSKHLAEVPYLERLSTQKSAFIGEERQRYMVTPMRCAARPFLALMNASGVALRSLVGKRLVESLIAPYRRMRS